MIIGFDPLLAIATPTTQLGPLLGRRLDEHAQDRGPGCDWIGVGGERRNVCQHGWSEDVRGVGAQWVCLCVMDVSVMVGRDGLTSMRV